MFTEPMLDPTGAFIRELQDDTDLDELVDGHVHGFEPGPEVTRNGVVTHPADAQPSGKYRRFVVVVPLGVPPEPRTPVTFATYAARCYGVTPQDASRVYGALVKAIHNIGPRLKESGLGIYQTLVISGGEQLKDPDTDQPYVLATIRLVATTHLVGVGS